MRNGACRLRYEGQFGGVAAMTTDHFRKINGYSNAFFGWGGEDDDIAVRSVRGRGLGG